MGNAKWLNVSTLVGLALKTATLAFGLWGVYGGV